MTAQADFSVDGLEYKINSPTTTPESVTLLGPDIGNPPSDITIPDTVLNMGINYDVTIVGEEAFDASRISYVYFDITIGNNVKTIQAESFRGQPIESVNIPTSVNTVGEYAFSGNELSSITIPDSVTSLGASAFFANKLTSVTIGNGITNIPLGCFAQNLLTSITIPENIQSIGIIAFQFNKLTTINIPSSVTTIGFHAFEMDDTVSSYTVNSAMTTPPIYNSFFMAYNSSTISLDDVKNKVDLIIPTGTTQAYTDAEWIDATLSTNTNFDLKEEEVGFSQTDDQIEIHISSDIQLKGHEIYSISGNSVQIGTNTKINTKSLNTGIYIINTKFDKGNYIRKFVIK